MGRRSGAASSVNKQSNVTSTIFFSIYTIFVVVVMMLKTVVLYCFVLGCGVLLCSVEGQVVRWGSCPDVPVKHNFTFTPYAGTWYEQQRYFAVFEAGLQCVSAEYDPAEGNNITVTNVGQKSDGTIVTASGIGYVPDPAEPAKLLIKFPGGGPAGAYWVIATDYQQFSVVWACTNVGPLRFMNSWLLSRQRTGFTHDAMEKIERILRKHQIDKEFYQPTAQVDCA